MEHLRKQDGFICMTNRVSEVEQISEPTFTLISRYNMGLDLDGAKNDSLEEFFDIFQ